MRLQFTAAQRPHSRRQNKTEKDQAWDHHDNGRSTTLGTERAVHWKTVRLCVSGEGGISIMRSVQLEHKGKLTSI